MHFHRRTATHRGSPLTTMEMQKTRAGAGKRHISVAPILNAARTKVSDYLEAQGFDRVQYSVFLGKVDPHRWQLVWAHLQKQFAKRCEPTDKIFSLVIEQDHFEKMGLLGNEIDRAWILQEVQVFFV